LLTLLLHSIRIYAMHTLLDFRREKFSFNRIAIHKFSPDIDAAEYFSTHG
jgi:hypothetical protein